MLEMLAGFLVLLWWGFGYSDLHPEHWYSCYLKPRFEVTTICNIQQLTLMAL